jgi:hypothetical protein
MKTFKVAHRGGSWDRWRVKMLATDRKHAMLEVQNLLETFGGEVRLTESDTVTGLNTNTYFKAETTKENPE